MQSNQETGHALNVANFERLINICQSFGTQFNPSKPSLNINNLLQQLTDAQNVMQEIKTVSADHHYNVNQRRRIFNQLRPLATRLINAFASTDANPFTIDDAKGLNRKIQGKRAKPKPKHNPNTADSLNPPPKTISASQQSFEQLCEHFAGLISILSRSTAYNPNETELQTSTLEALLDNMRAANTAAYTSYVEVSLCRSRRNKILYTDTNSIVNVAEDLKQYIKAIFGANSDQYKIALTTQIKKI